MFSLLPPKTHRKRYRVKLKAAPPPPVALTLVAAEFHSAGSPWLRVTFDRAVDIAGIDVAAFYVNDDNSDEAYGGTGTATLVSAAQVQVSMVIVHAATGPGTQLTVGADSGIVAVDDGGTWAGVTVLALPFP